MALDHEEVADMMFEEGCTGDRVTSELIESRIANVEYETIELCGKKFMFCGICMDNGFVVVGDPAACIDPSNWRDSIARKISYDNTFEELWRLEAYRKVSEKV